MVKSKLQPTASLDEITLGRYLIHLYQNKILILLPVIIFSVIGVIYSLSIPNEYRSDIVLVPTESDSGGSLSSLASKFGGVASLAGISLGSQESNTTTIALKTLESRAFIAYFIDKYELAVPLMGVEKWDSKENKLIYDTEIYNPESKKWIRDVSYPYTIEPSEAELYEVFRERMSVYQDEETGFVSVGFSYYSPILAQEYLQNLVKELNVWVGQRVDAETNRRIEHLKGQIKLNNIAELNAVFYELLTEEYKSKLLYQLGDSFAFKTLDPATLPQFKNSPKRALICIAFAIMGFVIGAIIASFRKMK
ncbi:Wzz/FepE/Etk N-terminal domain-containing protein [Pseudoalteromonas sp. YIC-656]|uniref:Wzz/FepE/Etk N-terminal domain-containing protein n=1 Tax=Pseudoalteromonas pernae TaxID=3118054 RepID=UPI003242F062